MWKRCLLLIVCAVTLAGCGSGDSRGPKRFEVKGTVTYQGKPVPYGQIMFEPDASQGNQGPGSGGTIENGSYLVKSDQGVISGPLKVVISGYDGVAPPGGGLNMHGKRLFPDFSAKVTQPAAAATHDFDIAGK
ncbi:hypothetical protein SH661x_002451 [Planctomicrobium sp. SH661]|uniref:hypothetical protein n=1 Tax=Planctomicrobium sp. SH661 TaxID=3448124 RepID=UPI003F5C106D